MLYENKDLDKNKGNSLIVEKIIEIRDKEEKIKLLLQDLKNLNKAMYSGFIDRITYFEIKNDIIRRINQLDIEIHEDIAYLKEYFGIEPKITIAKRKKEEQNRILNLLKERSPLVQMNILKKSKMNKNYRLPKLQKNIELSKEEVNKILKEYEIKLSPIIKQIIQLQHAKKIQKYIYKTRKKVPKLYTIPEKRPNYYRLLMKISNKMFYNIADHIIKTYPSLYRAIRLMLRKSSIRMTVKTFLSMILFIFLLSSTILFVATLILSRSLILSFISIAIESIIFLLTMLYIPYYRKKNLEKEVIDKLPFVIINMSILSKSDISPVDVIRVIASSDEYGYISKEFQRLLYYSESLGMGLLLAIKKVADTTPSQTLKEFLEEMYLSLSSGVSFKEFLRVAAETAIIQYKSNNDKFVQALKTFSDLYVGLVVTVPIILVSVIIMLSSLSESLFALPIDKVVKIMVYALVPSINILAIYMISKLTPK